MSVIGLPTGLHPRVPHDAYHAPTLGVVSKSALDEIAKSPAHYKAWVDGKIADRETPALVFGAAFHCALLEPERFASAYVCEPDFGDCRKKDNKAARDAWREANATAYQLCAEEMATIANMVAAVRAHPLASNMIRDGEPELTVRWRDEETGLQCKGRSDYYVRRLRMVADVKTTMDASPAEFRRDVARYRYHWQDALYRQGFAAAGEPVEHFVFIVVEKSMPHAVATYSLDADALRRGCERVASNMRLMADCLNSGQWPGYPVGIQTLDLPPWAA